MRRSWRVCNIFPDEAQLTREIDHALKQKQLDKAIVDLVAEWGRRSDFLRLYQAIYVGSRLQKLGINHVHAHFAGLAARTAFWINKFFGIPFSFHRARQRHFRAARISRSDLEKLLAPPAASLRSAITPPIFSKSGFRKTRPRFTASITGSIFQNSSARIFSNAVPTIVAIGRLIDKKGFADLIRACGLLKKRGRDFHCEIVGDGPLENELRAQIAELDLRSCVRLVGPKTQTQIVHQLANASVFVLPAVVDPDGARRQPADRDHGSDGGRTSGCFDIGWRNTRDGGAG